MVVFRKTTAIVVGLALTVSAAPTTLPRQFTVHQVARPVDKTVNAAATYARAIGKFGGTVPEDVLAAAASGSVMTTPSVGDVEYDTPVTVGSSTLYLDLDTGSSDLWVYSQNLPISQSGGHSIYQPSSSATKMNNFSWSISYGDGSSAGGDVYRDFVSVAGISTNRQAVETAQHVSPQFVQDTDNDGLMGLAFSDINTVQPRRQATFFDNVKPQLAAPVFAATLKHAAPGSYDFGYVDKSKYKGSLTYVPVDSSRGYWGFTSDSYVVGNGSPVSTPIDGIADTGTTLLLMPDAVVNDYYSQVRDAEYNTTYGGYIFPCSTSLPSFTVTINGYNAVVPGNLINFIAVTTDSPICYGGIQSSVPTSVCIFGDIFLKSQYVVFDASVPQLGFAPQA